MCFWDEEEFSGADVAFSGAYRDLRGADDDRVGPASQGRRFCGGIRGRNPGGCGAVAALFRADQDHRRPGGPLYADLPRSCPDALVGGT